MVVLSTPATHTACQRGHSQKPAGSAPDKLTCTTHHFVDGKFHRAPAPRGRYICCDDPWAGPVLVNTVLTLGVLPLSLWLLACMLTGVNDGRQHKYNRVKGLGKGGFGEAVLVEEKTTKKKYVIKEVRGVG